MPVGSLTSSERSRRAKTHLTLHGRVDQLITDYRSQLRGLLTLEQLQLGDWTIWADAIGRVNRLVIVGLVLCGASLMLGLFSRTVAMCAAALLVSFYIAMPPLPGLTAASTGRAHYLYVNNNLIEALALVVLATTHSGRWAGLDAVVHPVVNALFHRVRSRNRSASERHGEMERRLADGSLE